MSLVFVALLFYENILTTKFSQITVYETGFSCIIYDYIYTYRVSSDISHGRIKAAMDTNLLEVARSSETACTSVTCNRLNSIRMRLLAYCCLNAIQKQCQGYTQTTTKGDNYPKRSYHPESCTDRLFHSLVYAAISFLHTLHSYFHVYLHNRWRASFSKHNSWILISSWSLHRIWKNSGQMIYEAAKSNTDKAQKTTFIMTWRMQTPERTYMASSVTWITKGRHVCTTSGICCTNRCSQENSEKEKDNTSVDWSVEHL